jgi:hypothetical protein
MRADECDEASAVCARRISRDELTFEICGLFGWNRRGADIAAGLEEAIEELISQGALFGENGFLRVEGCLEWQNIL